MKTESSFLTNLGVLNDRSRLANGIATGLRRWVSSRMADLTSFILPGTCLVCDAAVEPHGGCCPKCWSKTRFVSSPFCPVMGTPFSIDLGDGMVCAEAIADPPPFSALRTVLIYDEIARKLVSGLKFSDKTNHARWMAKWMAVAGGEMAKEVDFIVPVPLHPSRLRSRKYNQSAELARAMCKQLDGLEKFDPALLARIRSTKNQIGLSQNERNRNVAGAFEVPIALKPVLKGRSVLLVDDVYTTGATMKAATRALKRGGAKEVKALVFAKVETKDL